MSSAIVAGPSLVVTVGTPLSAATKATVTCTEMNLNNGVSGVTFNVATSTPSDVSYASVASQGIDNSVLTVTMGPTGILTAAKAAAIACTSNLANNGAAGAVTFSISTSTDTAVLAGQKGYIITPAPVPPPPPPTPPTPSTPTPTSGTPSPSGTYSSGSGLSPTPVPSTLPANNLPATALPKYYIGATIWFSSMTVADFTPMVKNAFQYAMSVKMKVAISWVKLTVSQKTTTKVGARRAVNTAAIASIAFKVYKIKAATKSDLLGLDSFCKDTSTTGLASQFQQYAHFTSQTTINPGTVTVTVAPTARTVSSDSSGGGSNVGMIVGIVVGLFVIIGIGSGLYWYFVVQDSAPPKERLSTPREEHLPAQGAATVSMGSANVEMQSFPANSPGDTGETSGNDTVNEAAVDICVEEAVAEEVVEEYDKEDTKQGQELIGQKVSIWWEDEQVSYLGKVVEYSATEGYLVEYDGDETEAWHPRKDLRVLA